MQIKAGSNKVLDAEEIMTPQFGQDNQEQFFPSKQESKQNVFERNSTQYSGKRETEVGEQAIGTESGFRRDMSKQTTQETGLEINSNGGSTIRFGGSFQKKSGASKDQKGNFDEKIYSDIKGKNSQGNFGGSNIMMGSNIRVKEEKSNNEDADDDPMSFLNELIDPGNTEHLNTMSEHRRNPEMHRDAQQLRHYYDDNALTVVSEEASTRQTVLLGNNLSKKFSQVGMFPFESDISNSPSPISGNDTHFKTPEYSKNFHYSNRSGNNSSISGSSNNVMANSEIVGRMNRTKSAFLNPSPKGNFFMQQKRRKSTKLMPNQGMDDIKETSKQDLSQESGNLIPQSPIMRVSSEGSKNLTKRTFLPDDEEAMIKTKKENNNIFFGKFQPHPIGIMIHETNSLNDSEFQSGPQSSKLKLKNEWKVLPEAPTKPDYEISILANVSNKKEIQKKQAYVENTIFKLSKNGLYYDGSLKFGKLFGKGMLLLNMVDTSDENSQEVKENLLYKGEFDKNHVHGKGVIFFKNGTRFEGSFTNGVAHGSGKLFVSNGETIMGIWLNGKFNN